LIDRGFVVRMDAQESKIYGPRVLRLLKSAKQKLTEKYQTELPEPIYVDIYPRQQDFAIRTFGLPGGAGFLGVCFGQVITMNSPASQGATPSNWEAVLWHEFCHVVTLSKTKNRMPRWLSEGISVYEERQENPTWGQSLTLNFRKLILEGESTPVSQLSGAFLRPKSALHLQFAYFESALVVQYLIDKHGIETLNKILDDLGQGLTINDCLDRHTGSLEQLDQEFAAYIKSQAESLAKKADFTDPEFPRTATEETVQAYLKDHPHSFPALQRLVKLQLAAKKWEDAKSTLKQLYELHTQYIGSDSALNLLGLVHRELGETAEERAVLSQVALLEDDVVDVYLRLAELAAQENDWPAAAKHAEQALAVNPLIKPPHQYLTDAAEKLGNDTQAIGGLLALAEMDPVDPAGLSYRTAVLYQRTKQLPEARRLAIKSLEEAPRYRAAHRLLLEILDQQNQLTQPSPAIAEKQP
jgi:tetratricopeptide (TPR) repeat protein